MSVPTIPEYYHALLERGLGIVESGVWDSSATVTLSVSPATDEAFLIKEIRWSATDTFEFGTGDVLEITPWGNITSDTFTISSIADLIMMSDYTPVPGTTFLHSGVISFKPFIILRNDVSPVDEFSLVYNGVTGITSPEQLNLAIVGCKIDEADIGLGVE